ncbi:iron-sulfur cluster repair di-iron protein [Litoribacter ruber]|uniref:iron-sulfur cluster repair di-iron protein n=1 Tax=Litoribacter ruber TaxID=702568 RepID=UPI001BD98EB9|nr:iron-sulfur cluster repair di-iron protein [Litoribacter ruber]MBT0810356.1 iron-sulfur cluster repair di-iron protein [Litoribacter ruber]
MEITTQTIGELVAKDFRAATVFEKHGIDFCCKGGRTIEEACEKKEIDPLAVKEDLKKIFNTKDEGHVDFESWPLDLLADYIEKKHHRYVEDRIPLLLQYLNKLCKVHGHANRELIEINKLFYDTAQNLSAHMKKEELVLFPFVRKMVKYHQEGKSMNEPHFRTVKNPIMMMMDEHESEGERFEKIAELSNNYNPPAHACNTYQVTYKLLDEFEKDLHKHIHLENNILFPRAIKAEAETRFEVENT